MEGRNSVRFFWILFLKLGTVDWMQKVRMLVLEIYNFEKRNLELFNEAFGIFFLSLFRCKQNLDFVSFDESFQSKRLSSEIVMKKLNHAVFEKSDFQHPAKTIFVALFRQLGPQKELFQYKRFQSCFPKLGFCCNPKSETNWYLEKKKEVQVFIHIGI